MVFQDYALYPHMNVRKNLEFGLRSRGVGREAAREMALRPPSSSASARSSVANRGSSRGASAARRAREGDDPRPARAYLMDEPLSNLDASLRQRMRGELIDFHRKTAGRSSSSPTTRSRR